MKKIYYAHPITTYDSIIENIDIVLLESLGFEVINPNTNSIKKEFEKFKSKDNDYMAFFKNIIRKCDIVAFRSFPDLSIPAGVYSEIDYAIDLKIPVIEIPTFSSRKKLNIEDTRLYLKEIGRK